jgi:hypothetical protein
LAVWPESLGVEVEGGLYHVITRGRLSGQDLFIGMIDHLKFLSLLAKAKSKVAVLLYAYCQMTNPSSSADFGGAVLPSFDERSFV